jgi:hypothetical protein
MKLWVLAAGLSLAATAALVRRLRERRHQRGLRIGSQPVSSEWLAKARGREEHQY